MKKYLVMVIALVMVCAMAVPASAVSFDLSPFENSENYEIEFDDMDDTGTITLKSGGTIFGARFSDEDDTGYVIGNFIVRIIEGLPQVGDLPPVIVVYLNYVGDDWISTDEVIIKPADTRYTFEVKPNTSASDGKIVEQAVFVITDKSIQMLQDIVDNNVNAVRCRLSGDRDVDFALSFDIEALGALLDDYRASGALDNDFQAFEMVYPCTIK